MSLKRKKSPQPSTERGQVEWVTGLFFLLFLGILLCAALQMDIFRSSSRYLEDALALSNLASAVVDVEEYGISHRLVIDDPLQAYRRYQEAVKGNLNLDENWECPAVDIISGPINILCYAVYNVSGNDVEVSHFDENGLLTQWKETLGGSTAPNGIPIESTGVYSEISYQIKGLFGVTVEARKGKLADIVSNSGQDDLIAADGSGEEENERAE